MNIKVKIKGTADLLQNKLNLEGGEKISLRKTAETPEEEASKKAYKDENGYYFPSTWVEGMLVKSGAAFPMKGYGKKTWKDPVKGGVFCVEDKIRLSSKKYEIFRIAATNPNSRGKRIISRPLFKEGWEAQFTLSVIDERFTIGVIKELLDRGGQYIGMGDWRPKYGRFIVTECKEN